MTALPVIVGFGGVNAAGRSAFHHGYRRMIESTLSSAKMAPTWESLAQMMGLDTHAGLSPELIDIMRAGTLIRRIEKDHFDVDGVLSQTRADIDAGQDGIQFRARRSQLPADLPGNWQIIREEGRMVTVRITDTTTALFPEHKPYPVSSAGQAPNGFSAARLYRSMHHPRALSHAVYGASDAIQSLGMDWQDVLQRVRPDEVSVYAGSALGQVDQPGFGGLFQNGLTGGRTSSKMMPLSFAEMAADFINGYMINSVGSTGASMGACATFLYNLRQGVMDIQAGKARAVIVGNTEAPVVPAIMEGFNVMGALATDEELKRLDDTDQVNNRRACRPFSSNAGFTIAESSQFMILMDDTLALELGATVYGSVPDVFINADANKKSISAPGVGNYITVAKSAALLQSLLGEGGLQHTFVQAHGTGTPQNRVTESRILNEVARLHGLSDWAVTAMKAYVGHSLGPAAGDQIMPTLGVWAEGVIPGIETIDHIAEDVHDSHLNILQHHLDLGDTAAMRGCLINSKGFGGNNSTAALLSPQETLAMLGRRHGERALTDYRQRNEAVQRAQAEYDARAVREGVPIIYRFGESVMDDGDITLGVGELGLSEFRHAVRLDGSHPYDDLV